MSYPKDTTVSTSTRRGVRTAAEGNPRAVRTSISDIDYEKAMGRTKEEVRKGEERQRLFATGAEWDKDGKTVYYTVKGI